MACHSLSFASMDHGKSWQWCIIKPENIIDTFNLFSSTLVLGTL